MFLLPLVWSEIYGSRLQRGAWWFVETLGDDFIDEPSHGAESISKKLRNFSTSSYALLEMDMTAAAQKV